MFYESVYEYIQVIAVQFLQAFLVLIQYLTMSTKNYKSLVDELQRLIKDQEVIQQIEPVLLERAKRLITSNSPNKTHSLQKNIGLRVRDENCNNVTSQIKKSSNKTKNRQKSPQNCDPRYKYKKQVQFLDQIEDRQIETKQQRIYLEGKINQLKHLIQQERIRLSSANKQIGSLKQNLGKLQDNSQSLYSNYQLSKRKLQSIFSEVKILNQSLEQIKLQDKDVKNSLNQQKELIKMYKIVIQELKSQMKIEKEQYDDIKKKVIQLRKAQQVTKIKYENANENTDGIINQIKQSLQKWK